MYFIVFNCFWYRYCGYGIGGVYLGGSDFVSLDCRAVIIFMGCSSGKLEVIGYLEVIGFMFNYFMVGW